MGPAPSTTVCTSRPGTALACPTGHRRPAAGSTSGSGTGTGEGWALSPAMAAMPAAACAHTGAIAKRRQVADELPRVRPCHRRRVLVGKPVRKRAPMPGRAARKAPASARVHASTAHATGQAPPPPPANSGEEEEEEGPAYACFPAVANVLGMGTRGTLYDSPSQITSPITPQITSPITPQRYPLGWRATPVMVHVMVHDLCRPLVTVGYPRV